MKQERRLMRLAALGLAGIGIAWGLRVHTLRTAAHRARTVPNNLIAAMEHQLITLRAAVAAEPRSGEARLALADFYRQAGDIRRAADQLETAVRLDLNNQSAFLALAAARLSLLQYPQAEATYREITRRWPKYAYGWVGLASALYHEGRYLESAEDAERAMRLNPKDPNGRIVLATSALNYALQFPDPTIHSGELNLARVELEKLTKTFPDNGDLWYLLGRTDGGLHHNSGQIIALARAAALLPDNAGAAKDLALAYKAAGDFAAARKAIESGLSRHPDNAAMNDIYGQLLQASGEPGVEQKAMAAFERAVQLKPEDPFFQERLGVARVRTGKLQEARAAFETAARLNPYLVFPHQQLAALYTRLRDPKRAAEAVKTAHANEVKDRELSRLQLQSQAHQGNVQFHLALADRYREIGLTGAARDEYLTALDLSKGNPRAQQGLRLLATAASASH